jgi:AraC-like DNA-binding protein
MPPDPTATLFSHLRVRAHRFHDGPLCGVTHYGDGDPPCGHLHLLRAGQATLTHPPGLGLPTRLRLTEPMLVLYAAPTRHGFHTVARDAADLVCAALRFEGGAEHPLARGLPPLIALPLRELPALQPTLALLWAESAHAPLADRLIEVLLLQLVRSLLASPERYPLPAGVLAGWGDAALARVLAALQARPAEPWTLPRMAREAGLSRSLFADRFRRVVGTTPAAHLTQLRLQIAQAQLARGRSITQAAEAAGYGSASALSRAFQARLGVAPSQWRRAAANA